MGWQTFTLYAADDVTVLTDCSDDPSHARPFLKRVMLNGIPSEPNVRDGTMRVGSQDVEIVDVPRIASDQRTGWLTFVAYDADGNSAILSRRGRLVEDEGLPGERMLFDGIVTNKVLLSQIVTLRLTMHDISERERRMRAFVRADRTLLIPRGHKDGWGTIGRVDFGGLHFAVQLMPPGKWYGATYKRDPERPGAGVAYFDNRDVVRNDFTDDEWRTIVTYGMPVTLSTPEPPRQRLAVFQNVALYWRPFADTNPAHEIKLTNMTAPTRSALSQYFNAIMAVIIPADVTLVNQQHVDLSRGIAITEPMAGAPAGWQPADGAHIEIQIANAGPPTSDAPFYGEWPSFGHLLEALGNGSLADVETMAPLRINAASLAAFKQRTPMARVRKDGPEADAWAWAAPNVFKATGHFPIINDAGEIEIVPNALPDASVDLVQLDDTNCTFVREWEHNVDSVINRVRFSYKIVTFGPHNQIDEVDAIEEEADIDSIAQHGTKLLEFAPETVRGLWATDESAQIPSTFLDPSADALIEPRIIESSHRFRGGNPSYVVTGILVDPAVAALREGAWVLLNISTFPDQLAHLRGTDRMAQVVGITRTDPAVRRFKLVDAGPGTAPLAAPTADAPTHDDVARTVSVNVTAVPAGAEVQLQLAVGDTLPMSEDGRWMPFGRSDVPALFTSRAIFAATTVWTRYRSVAKGKRPSVWSAPVASVFPVTAAIGTMRVTYDAAGLVTLAWTVSPATLGLRIGYNVHALDAAPGAFTMLDVDAALGTVTLAPNVRQLQQMSITVVPYTGFAAGAVSGTAGTLDRLTVTRDDRATPLPVAVREQTSVNPAVGTLVLDVVDPQARITHVYFATAVGNSPLSSFVEDASLPYSCDVALGDKEPSRVAYRVEGIGADGVERILAENVVPFSASTTPIATIDVPATAVSDVAIGDTVSRGAGTTWVDVWSLEYTSDPGAVPSVEGIGIRRDPPLLHGDGVGVVTFAVAAPGHYIVRTYIAYDALGKRGQVRTIKTQAASVAPTYPPDMAAIALVAGSATPSGATLRVTMPSSVALVASIRLRAAGMADVTVARTAGAGATQDIAVASLASGTTYSATAYGVTAGGLESTAAPAPAAFTTSALPALDPPVLGFDHRSGRFVFITIDAGANDVNGDSVYHVERDTGSGFAPFDDFSAGPAIIADTSTTPKDFRARADSPTLGVSAYSNVITG